MNRREFIAACGGLATLPMIGKVECLPKVEYPFWTKPQLIKLFNLFDGKITREIVDLQELKDWNGELLKPEELVHLAIMRMSNIMHRKTLDRTSNHWMVMNPNTCSKDIWSKHVFHDYSTPGKEGGRWLKRHWYARVTERTSPEVYKLGNLCGKWQMYVCDGGFPDNKIMLGMGFKQVVHFRREGMKVDEWGERPNFVPYMDRPTVKNFAIITLN